MLDVNKEKDLEENKFLGHLSADDDFVDNCLKAGRRQRKRFKGED